MKFFKELLNYDMKSDQSLKTRLYQMYILEIESKLGIPLYHQYPYSKENEGNISYNELQYHIIYQDILLLQDILVKSSMEGLFFAFYGDDTESAFEECKEEFYQLIMEEGDFPEFKDNKQFNVKLIKGKSVEKLLDETQERLTQNVIGRSDEDVLYPTMFLLIRENDDLLYKIRFLQKINYPLDQKRVDQILNGRYFLDVFGSSDLLIDGAIYHFCVLTVHSKVNLWKWITLMQEHKYIEHCYIDALSGNNAGGKNYEPKNS